MSTGDELMIVSMDEIPEEHKQKTGGAIRMMIDQTDQSWIGMLKTDPDSDSGWHHHGDYDSYIYLVEGEAILKYGKNGEKELEVEDGDIVKVPSKVIHREFNPSSDKENVAFLVRVGSGKPLFNVDGPA